GRVDFENQHENRKPFNFVYYFPADPDRGNRGGPRVAASAPAAGPGRRRAFLAGGSTGSQWRTAAANGRDLGRDAQGDGSVVSEAASAGPAAPPGNRRVADAGAEGGI